MTRAANSETIVAAMAADLRRFRAAGTEPDAIRSLLATRNYSPFDIMQLVDRARARAGAAPPANCNKTFGDLAADYLGVELSKTEA